MLIIANFGSNQVSLTCSWINLIFHYDRENGNLRGGSPILEPDSLGGVASEDLKRERPVSSEAPYPNKSPKIFQGDQQSSPSGNGSSQNQHKREKMDWSVLRPPKNQKKKK